MRDMVAIGDIATNSIVALVIVATTHIVAIDYIATKHCVARTRQYCNAIASWE
jgi:hypothetical protein